MDILIIQVLNSVFYACILFLIAAGLSLIYGVMRIVNLAHGSLYAFGAYVTAWSIGTFGIRPWYLSPSTASRKARLTIANSRLISAFDAPAASR